MQPIEILDLCLVAANKGAPDDVFVPRIFERGDYENMWTQNPEHVRATLQAILLADHPDDGLEMLMKAGIIRALFPELAALKDLGGDAFNDDEGLVHKNVWLHTKQVVKNSSAISHVRWACLFHDIGKSRTRQFIDGEVTFHNHDVVGARMLDKLQKRMNLFDDKTFSIIRSLVLNHMRPHAYADDWTDSGCRRLVTDVGGYVNFHLLMAVSRADVTSKHASKRAIAAERVRALSAHVCELRIIDNKPKLPKRTMGIIIERGICGIGPGLNAIREGLEEMMFHGDLPIDKDAEWYAVEGTKLLKARKEGT